MQLELTKLDSEKTIPFILGMLAKQCYFMDKMADPNFLKTGQFFAVLPESPKHEIYDFDSGNIFYKIGLKKSVRDLIFDFCSGYL